MSNIKDQIISELKRRHDNYREALEKIDNPRDKVAIDLMARMREITSISVFITYSLKDEQH